MLSLQREQAVFMLGWQSWNLILYAYSIWNVASLLKWVANEQCFLLTCLLQTAMWEFTRVVEKASQFVPKAEWRFELFLFSNGPYPLLHIKKSVCIVFAFKSLPLFCFINNSFLYPSPPLCLSSLYGQNVGLLDLFLVLYSYFLCQLILMLHVILCAASTLRERPWSAIFSPEEHSVIVPSRRPNSIMPFHSSNLSKSMSINNIAMLVHKHLRQQVLSGFNIYIQFIFNINLYINFELF